MPPILDVVEARPEAARDERGVARRPSAPARARGLFAGVSSGAVVHVARRLAADLEEGGVVVCVLADGGWKYLSAAFWDSASPPRRWRTEAGGSARRGPGRARPARRRRGPERGVRGRRSARRPRRSLRARAVTACLALPLRARRRSGRLVPRGRRATSSPSSTRTRPTRRGPHEPTSRTSASGRAGRTSSSRRDRRARRLAHRRRRAGVAGARYFVTVNDPCMKSL